MRLAINPHGDELIGVGAHDSYHFDANDFSFEIDFGNFSEKKGYIQVQSTVEYLA